MVPVSNEEREAMQNIKDSRRFLALDLETTGLNPQKDTVLEVAWFILDGELNPLTGPKKLTIRPSLDEIEMLYNADTHVREMHAKTGLTAELMTGGDGVRLDQIEDEILDDIENNMPRVSDSDDELEQVTECVPVHLLGNSVHFDRAFLKECMMLLDEKLHYRILDVTSLVMFFEARTGESIEKHFNFNKDGSGVKHRALADVNESYHLAEAIGDLFEGGIR